MSTKQACHTQPGGYYAVL